MPMDFAEPNFLVHRATRVWGWRFPNKDESEAEYRTAFATYVALSDPEEAKAIRDKEVFVKFDSPTTKKKKKE
jgi:hypothetical protein